MTPHVRYGLIVGGIGAIFNIGVSALFGFCGPFATLIAGGLAGWLAARALSEMPRPESAKKGAIAGAITGSLMLIGQVIGGIGALFLFQVTKTPLPLGNLPTNGFETVAFYASGIAVSLCFGIIGLVLGAGVGGAAGYFAWKALEVQPTPQYEVQPPIE